MRARSLIGHAQRPLPLFRGEERNRDLLSATRETPTILNSAFGPGTRPIDTRINSDEAGRRHRGCVGIPY